MTRIENRTQIQPNMEKKESIIHRYDKHFESYAGKNNLNSLFVKKARNALLEAVYIGIEKNHGIDITLGIALLFGDIRARRNINPSKSLLWKDHIASKEERNKEFESKTTLKIEEISKFLEKEFTTEYDSGENSKIIPATHNAQEYKEILNNIKNGWTKLWFNL